MNAVDPLGLDYCTDKDGHIMPLDAGGGDDYSCAQAGGNWVTEQDPNQTADVSTDVSSPPTLGDDNEFLNMWWLGLGPTSISYGPNDGKVRSSRMR